MVELAKQAKHRVTLTVILISKKLNWTMKRMMKLWSIVAVAAMGLVACQNNFEEPTTNVNIKNSITVSFVSESARTSVDTSGDTPLFSWNESETFAVLEQTDALAKATSVAYTKVDGKANIDAEFAVNEGKSEYKYIAVYPESGYVSASNINAATLTLPANQTAVEGSYDPNADLMVSLPITTNAQPTDVLPLRFTRLAAVVEMSLKNFALEAGDAVEKIIFTATDKSLAGSVTADLTNPHEFVVNEGVSSVEVATTSADKVYFTVLPATLEAGNEYSVMVLTNKKFYVKTGTIPEGKSLAFEAGKVTRFGVNLSGATSSDRWELVRDASTLKQGDIVAIVAKDYDKALSKKLYGNNVSETSISAKRGVAEISKLGDFLIASADVQPLTLMTGVAEGTFSFYDEARNKFLVSTTTGSTYLINQVYCDVNTSFAITIDNTTTAATITNTEGEYKGNLLRYNTNGYFVSNQNTSAAYKDVCIYRRGGVVGEIPVVAANVTVPDSDEQVVIAEEGAQSATAIEEVVFNYVGDWTISVSDNAEWLAVAYDATNKKVTYTAEANTGAKRDAVVTITASLEGQEALSWSFNLLQKGAPQEISIEEFAKKGKDVDTVYKLTGIIAEIPSSTSGKFKIADENGNTAQVQYLKTEDGQYVKGNIDVKVGDVISLTTVVAGTTTGLGGHSSYPSIYKGHYGLALSVGTAAEYTGGNVVIEVSRICNGIITAPTAVEATMAECDYATLTYNGGTSATVTFPNENTTSDAREATVTFTYGLAKTIVTVEQGINPANKIGYELVTDASTLAIGDEVIIVARNKEKALGVSSSTITSQSNFPAVAIEKTGPVIYDADKAGVQPFTLVSGNSAGKFGFQFTHKDVDYYLYVYSTNGLRGRKVSDGLNDRTSYTITIDSTSGSATILDSVNTRYVKFNGTSETTFLNTSETNAAKESYDVCIYKKQK